ncbi:hypothetical protein F5Y06DRAFT_287648 [Hypoxylon sp. FL0890]|nr:hypothetical protein F5Y06DRAFT_287648 [Hypoxylon sp. FL0890]
MSSSSPTLNQTPANMGYSRLLSLPFELRLDIYERYLYSEQFGAIDEGLMCLTESESPSTALLLTCKQIYEEARPLLYQKVTISYSLDIWERFFDRIGPYNISLIRDLTIYYSCCPSDYWRECHGCKPEDGEPKKIDKWLPIFNALHRAKPNLRLKTITLYVDPCEGYWPGESETDLSFLLNNKRYRDCRIYQELGLLKMVSQLSSVHQIVLKNKFNPLWGMFFRHRLGFILKRGQHGQMTLVNPNHPLYRVDLRNYEPSKFLKGVYDEIPEKPKESEAPKEPGEPEESEESEEPEEPEEREEAEMDLDTAGFMNMLASWIIRDPDESDAHDEEW